MGNAGNAVILLRRRVLRSFSEGGGYGGQVVREVGAGISNLEYGI